MSSLTQDPPVSLQSIGSPDWLVLLVSDGTIVRRRKLNLFRAISDKDLRGQHSGSPFEFSREFNFCLFLLWGWRGVVEEQRGGLTH